MFDYEKEEQATPKAYENADWEQITDTHASAEEASGRAGARHNVENGRREIFDNFYKKSEQRRRERTAITAVRYAMLAIGLTAVAWLVREITGLSITLGGIALIFGLTAAYGAGKYREM